MENGPFIDNFPIKTSIYKGFSMAMLNNQKLRCPPSVGRWLVWGHDPVDYPGGAQRLRILSDPNHKVGHPSL